MLFINVIACGAAALQLSFGGVESAPVFTPSTDEIQNALNAFLQANPNANVDLSTMQPVQSVDFPPNFQPPTSNSPDLGLVFGAGFDNNFDDAMNGIIDDDYEDDYDEDLGDESEFIQNFKPVSTSGGGSSSNTNTPSYNPPSYNTPSSNNNGGYSNTNSNSGSYNNNNQNSNSGSNNNNPNPMPIVNNNIPVPGSLFGSSTQNVVPDKPPTVNSNSFGQQSQPQRQQQQQQQQTYNTPSQTVQQAEAQIPSAFTANQKDTNNQNNDLSVLNNVAAGKNSYPEDLNMKSDLHSKQGDEYKQLLEMSKEECTSKYCRGVSDVSQRETVYRCQLCNLIQ